ncbi:AP-4 complex subunit beta-1-like isoform X1 [Asterias amurensis]|uniref:AP-4 complex subunit beta-1-like isoform X1 n=1 Tax=Asterias amurensis TaxID=7602 RepID=UPI003AB8B756
MAAYTAAAPLKVAWLACAQKRSPLTKVTPVRFPHGAICELSCALVLCCATRVFQNIRFSSLGKNQTLLILAVLRGHNWLMWLAAKGALACLLLKHVVAASFAIQLLAASKDDYPPKLLNHYTVLCTGISLIPQNIALHFKYSQLGKHFFICIVSMHKIDLRLASFPLFWVLESFFVLVDHGIVNMLYEMLRDGDVIVVINCLLALEELLDHEGGIAINRRIAHYLVNRLSEFTEWGQCCVLQLLLKYTPQSEDEMFDMMNVVDAFLKHTNSGVCMAAVRLMLHLTTDLPDISKDVYNRLKGPLLNLLSSDRPELVHTALCHLEWFNTRLPGRLAKYYKKFYCRYNDPGYVKYKKIELLSSLCSEDSLKDIVEELSVYATDISVRLSHLAVAALGKLAKTSIAYSGPCVEALLTLLSLQLDSVSSQVLVVFQDILRYEHLKEFIPAVVERLPSCEQLIQEPCGKGALVGLIAQYGQDLPDAPYILESMIDTLEEERNTMVKLSLLTATIKLFFIRPAECQDMLGKILEYAIECESNADLQEKAKMYYRLLSKDVQKAKDIISAPPSRLSVPCPSDTSADVHHFNSIALLFGPDRWREIQKSNYGEENEGHGPLSFVELKPNDGELELDITATGQLLDLDGVTSEFKSEVTPEVMLENDAEAIPMASTLVSLGGVEPEVMSAVCSDGVTTETITRVTTEVKFLTNVSLAPEEFEGKWTTWKSCELQELKIMKSLQPKDIQRQLEKLGCKTMATTPEDSAPWRAFLYAKEDHTEQLFLIEVALDLVNDLLTFDIRCDGGQTSIDQAASVVKKLLLDAVS